MKRLRSIIRHLLALLALLLFCGGWAAAQLRLVLPAPMECSKTCCLDSGECCCLLAVEVGHDEHVPPAFKRLHSECAQFPAATFSTKLPQFSLRTEPKPAPRLPEIHLPRIGFAAPDILSFLIACEKSPRAPPQPAAL